MYLHIPLDDLKIINGLITKLNNREGSALLFNAS